MSVNKTNNQGVNLQDFIEAQQRAKEKTASNLEKGASVVSTVGQVSKAFGPVGAIVGTVCDVASVGLQAGAAGTRGDVGGAITTVATGGLKLGQKAGDSTTESRAPKNKAVSSSAEQTAESSFKANQKGSKGTTKK